MREVVVAMISAATAAVTLVVVAILLSSSATKFYNFCVRLQQNKNLCVLLFLLLYYKIKVSTAVAKAHELCS